MNETVINAQIATLVEQRNIALNALAVQAGEIALLRRQLADAQASIEQASAPAQDKKVIDGQ